MNTIHAILIFSFSFLLFSCQKEEKSPLRGCCENDILNESFGNAHVYVANIFTPNGDGLNDFLYVLGDSIRQIIVFEVKNKNGEIVFQIENSQVGGVENRWDGKTNGIIQKGLYNFSLSVEADDGTIGNYHGQACNYPCGLMEGEEMISMDGCHFGVEYLWYTEFIPDPPVADLTECFK